MRTCATLIPPSPLSPCTQSYAFDLTPPLPLCAYVLCTWALWKLFELGCLHQHTVITLYRLDRNEKLLETFAYPSNKCAFCGPELNLQNHVFHLISRCGNFLKRHSFCIVSGDSPEILRKLCVFTKFTHHEIRWNFGILRSVTF